LICPAIAHTRTAHTRLKNLQNPAGKQAKASPNPRLAGLVASCKCSNSSKNSYNSYNNGQICMRVGVLHAHSQRERESGAQLPFPLPSPLPSPGPDLQHRAPHAPRSHPSKQEVNCSRPRLAAACSSCSSLAPPKKQEVMITRTPALGTSCFSNATPASTNAPAPSSFSSVQLCLCGPVLSPSVATRVARTRTASAAQLPQLPVLSQLSQIDHSSPNPASLQGLKVWKSLESVAYPIFHTLSLRLFLAFSTGRRMFEPEL